MKRNFVFAVCRGATVMGALWCTITFAYQSSDADRAFQQARNLFNQLNWDKAAIGAGKALKEEAHRRDRVLQSLAAIATNEPRSGEQP